MRLSISEELKKINDEKNLDKRRQLLLNCKSNQALLIILKAAYDPAIKFDLPPGAPPYKPCEYQDQQAMLYGSIKKLQYFTDQSNLKPLKKEVLFINLIESLDPEDAKLVIAVKDKSLPYENITKEFIESVYPGLLK